MKLKLILAALVISLVLAAVPSASWAIGLEAAIGIWGQSPDGDVQYKQGTDKLDLKDDFFFEDEQRMMARLKIDMPAIIPNIYLMGTKMNFEGKGTTTVDITYGDETFVIGSDLETELLLDHYDIALYYGLPFIETLSMDMLNIELGLNARMVDIEATVKAAGQKETADVSVVIPMLYAGIQIRPTDKLAFEIEGRGVSYSGNSLYDAIARLKLKPLGPIFIAAGYRYESLTVDEDDVKAKIVFEGPFAEAGFQF